MISPKQNTNSLRNWVVIALLVLLVGGFMFWQWKYASTTSNPSPQVNVPTGPIPAAPESVSAATDKIDPRSFKTVSEFLGKVKLGTGSVVDLTKDNFVISYATASGTLYIPFTQSNIWGDLFKGDLEKNAAIIDIFKAIKEGKVHLDANNGKRGVSTVSINESIEHSSTKDIAAIYNGRANVYEIQKGLSSIENITKSAGEYLAYTYDLTGDYAKSQALRDNLCKRYPDTCTIDMKVTYTGFIRDNKWTGIAGTTITILNTPADTAVTDSKGAYTLKTDAYPLARIRLKATKTGYSDGFTMSEINTYGASSREMRLEKDFVILPADKQVTLNTDTANENGEWEFESTQSKYRLKKDALYYLDGTGYTGKEVKVNLYEFTKTSNLDSLATSDTFSPVYGYVGSLMKTFGMPYIQFFDPAGKELFVHKSNPMILVNRIYHMKELYENSDKIYTALSKDDMKFLKKKSDELGGYPLDMTFLTTNNFLRWPAWWALDRKKGVWENIGSKVTDESGIVEVPFYTINDIDNK